MIATSHWTERDIPDLSGRTALVTGANSGLGLETARMLAAHGAVVLMAARNDKRLEDAIGEITRRHPAAALEPVVVDLASLASVRAAASTVLAAHGRLDILVNNAGVMAIPRAETVDGFEMQFATNCLGHFALTGLLLSALLSSPGSRVVFITSIARHRSRIDFDDLHGRSRYGRWNAYSQSKLADLVYAVELDRRLRTAEAGTLAVAAHPGYAATNLQHGTTWLQNTAYGIGNILFAQSATAGAWPQVYAATMPEVQGGELYAPGFIGHTRGYPRRARIEPRALKTETGRRLWEVSADATGVRYEALGGSVAS